jgi:hypothetical protein
MPAQGAIRQMNAVGSLENDQGDVVGKRWRHYEFGKAEWMWFYEPDAFQ